MASLAPLALARLPDICVGFFYTRLADQSMRQRFFCSKYLLQKEYNYFNGQLACILLKVGCIILNRFLENLA